MTHPADCDDNNITTQQTNAVIQLHEQNCPSRGPKSSDEPPCSSPISFLHTVKSQKTAMSKSISPRLSLTTFRPNYSPKYNPKMHQSPFLSGSTKLKLPEDRRVEDRDRKSHSSGHGLSWSILKIPNAQCSKSVVRNWAARRVRAAFEEALRGGGLGRDGRVLMVKRDGEVSLHGNEDVGSGMNVAGEGHHTEQTPIKPLSGSLLLRVEAATVTASKETLDRDAETVVKWLLKQQQGQYGQGRADSIKRLSRSNTKRVG